MSQEIEKKIIEIENILAENSLNEGITAVSGTLAHILTMAINQNAFDRNRLNAFFEEIEARIMANTKSLNPVISRDNSKIGIKRDVK